MPTTKISIASSGGREMLKKMLADQAKMNIEIPNGMTDQMISSAVEPCTAVATSLPVRRL